MCPFFSVPLNQLKHGLQENEEIFKCFRNSFYQKHICVLFVRAGAGDRYMLGINNIKLTVNVNLVIQN